MYLVYNRPAARVYQCKSEPGRLGDLDGYGVLARQTVPILARE